MKTLARALASALTVAALGACTSVVSGSGSVTNHAPPENAASPVDALDDPTHPGLEACKGNVSPNDLEDALEIGRDFRESCHELVACGALASSFGTAVIEVLLYAAIGGTAPNVQYLGDGTYRFGSGGGDAGAGLSMDVTLRLPSDTSFGKSGDLIKFNLLDLSSYFTGAKVTASAKIGTSGTSYSLGVTYTGKGPAFELLETAAAETGNLSIDSAAVERALGKLVMSYSIAQSDKQGHALFTYDVKSEPQAIESMLAGDPQKLSLTNITGGRQDLGQTLSLQSFATNYLETGHAGYLDGTIAWSIAGGKLPFAGSFHYPSRKTPDVTLSCK
jgi:hypothetical protein